MQDNTHLQASRSTTFLTTMNAIKRKCLQHLLKMDRIEQTSCHLQKGLSKEHISKQLTIAHVWIESHETSIVLCPNL